MPEPTQKELIELEVKRAVSSEIASFVKAVETHQAYLEKTTNWFVKGVGVVAVAATGMFYFFFGHSIPEAVKNSVSQLEVVSASKNQLTNQLAVFTQFEIGSASNKISSAAIKLIDELKQTTLRSEVEKAVAHFPAQDLTNLIRAVPAGTIAAYGGDDVRPESGWLRCDGAPVPRAQYPNLFKAIGTTWGAGDTNSTFNLPDLQGMFLRGVDSSGKIDPDNKTRINRQGQQVGPVAGSIQADAVGPHAHGLTIGSPSLELGSRANTSYAGKNHSTESAGNISHETMKIGEGIQTETRPKNAYVYYIIKY